ncbi:hypothetical protein SCUP515_00311 [Seiridium cupressi]
MAPKGPKVATNAKHECKASGCRLNRGWKRNLKGEKEYSVYCNDHTCGAREPHVNTAFCPYRKEKYNLFCPLHQKCGARDCLQHGEYPKDQQHLPWLCSDHKCAEKTCWARKISSSYYCGEHQYLELPPGCIVSNCHKSAMGHSYYCKSHGCAVANCDKSGGRSRRCAEHMDCLKPDCKHFATEGHSFCVHHWYCHRSDCCDIAEDSSEYCLEHMCGLRNCVHARTSRSEFCEDHTCEEPNCPQARSDTAKAGIKFCYTHQCQKNGCVQRAQVTNGYCQSHACTKASCLNKRASSQSAFCQEHECKEEGCHVDATTRGGYCELNRHGCNKRECLRHSAYPNMTHPLCIDHLIEAEREAAAAAAAAAAFTEIGSGYDDEVSRLQAEVQKLQLEKDYTARRDAERRMHDEQRAKEHRAEEYIRAERARREQENRERWEQFQRAQYQGRRTPPYPDRDYTTDESSDDSRHASYPQVPRAPRKDSYYSRARPTDPRREPNRKPTGYRSSQERYYY